MLQGQSAERSGIVGVRASRTLVVRERLRISWLVELLPAIVATVSAPANRRPFQVNDNGARDRSPVERYLVRDTYGVGFAPLGAEISRAETERLSLSFSVTAGAARFSEVVPYGKATRANFTAAPALGLEWMLTDRYAISSGYALHHVSNAGLGESNPGLNAHLVYVKLAVARFGARP